MKFRMFFAKKSFQIIILILTTTLTQGMNEIYAPGKTRHISTMPADLKKLAIKVWCAGNDEFTTLCQGFPQYDRCIGEVIQEEIYRVMDIIDLFDYSAHTLGKNLLFTKCEEQTMNSETSEIEDVNNIPFYLLISVAAIGFLALLAMTIIICIQRKYRLNINDNNTIISSGASKNFKKMSSIEDKV